MSAEVYAVHGPILAISSGRPADIDGAIAAAGGLVVPGSAEPRLALFAEDRADAAVDCFASVAALGVAPRAAIATGVLEVTASPDAPPILVGDALDRVRALFSAARPGQLLVDEETRAQLRRHMAEPLESFPAKGRSEPLRVYRVVPTPSGPATLHKVYGSMLEAMGGGRATRVGAAEAVGEPHRLEDLWERSVAAGRWARPAPPEAADPTADAIDCTVFAPPEATAGGSFLVQVFAHLFESAEQVAGLAVEMDPDARRRVFKSLEVPVARGETLAFELRMPDLLIDDPVQSLVWNGRPQSVQFGVSVPGDRPAGTVIGAVTISRRSVPIGHLKFKLAVATDAAGAREPEPTGESACRYTRAFVSYASADRRRVLERVQMLSAVGIRHFEDVLDLEPGERWERELYRRIDECDLFLLFWSRAAKDSEWVRREVAYALARKRGDDLAPPEIRPVILEGPPIVPPPDELAHLHFSDRLIYFLAAES